MQQCIIVCILQDGLKLLIKSHFQSAKNWNKWIERKCAKLVEDLGIHQRSLVWQGYDRPGGTEDRNSG